MADEIVYKKMTRKADKGLEGKVVAKHGKQTNQKLKPYVVLEYLMKYSDENNTKSAYDIIGYLEGCGISVERRSIYRDIEDINRIMLILQEDIDYERSTTFPLIMGCLAISFPPRIINLYYAKYLTLL